MQNFNRLVAVLVPATALMVALPLKAALAEEKQPVVRRGVDAQLAKAQARIAELQKRIAALESRLNTIVAAQAAAAQATRAEQSADGARPVSAIATLRTNRALLAQAAPAPHNAAPAPRPGQTAAQPAAGSFEVDEEATQRALERTLTQTGALLLPPGTYEITPAFQYNRYEIDVLGLVNFTNPGDGSTGTSLAESRIRRNEFTPRIDFRVGLPMNAQLEASLPYTRSTAEVRTAGNGSVNDFSSHGWGDITVGVAKTLLREKGFQPDLIGRLTYNTGSGETLSGPQAVGAGFRQFSAEVLMVKRQDPLAFVGSFSVGHPFERDNVQPGDVFALSLSSILAASPATSLQLGFSQIHRQKQERNGATIAGSDQTYGLFNLGVSSVLSRDMTLVTQFGIGVGNDAPKYTINVALPILFR